MQLGSVASVYEMTTLVGHVDRLLVLSLVPMLRIIERGEDMVARERHQKHG